MTRSFHLLGRLQIEEDGQALGIMKSDKGCALLAYLIVTKQSQPREKVADIIGDASSTQKSLQNLRYLLSSTIRKWVPEVKIERKVLTFVPHEQTSVDFYDLQVALANDNVEQLDKALKRYRGDLLADFYLVDAPRFNEWLQVSREQLRRRVYDAFQNLCQTYAELQAWAKGVSLAQHWLSLDELDEDALFWLMRFLAANGQVTDALTQYELGVARLEQELGLEPAKEIALLAQQLKALEQTTKASMLGASIFTPANRDELVLGTLAEPGPLPPHTILPYHRNTTFIGRTDLLLSLAEHLVLSQGSSQLLPAIVAITGMGGLGKTQLAVEYAYRYGRYYPGGVYWISFAQAEAVEEEIARMGGEGGMALFKDKDKLALPEKLTHVRRAWQEPVPRLLIFDNCEDEYLAADWLPITGGCSVLITSRLAQWPQEMPIISLPLPVLSDEASVSMLQTLASHISAAKASDIASELGYLPLALQLAGSFLRRYKKRSVDQYLAQLQKQRLTQHASLRGEHSRYSPTRHELNVSRTFAVSLEQLNPSDEIDHIARQLLVRAANFAAGEPVPQDLLLATLIAVEDSASLNEVEATHNSSLLRLTNLGLLRADGDKWVEMHRLVAAYTHEHFGEDRGAETAVVDTLIQTLLDHRQEYTKLSTLPFSYIHLHHVSQKALQEDRARTLPIARLIYLLGTHLKDIVNFEEARFYLQESLTYHTELLGADHVKTADVLLEFGSLFLEMGQYNKVLPYFEQVLAIRKKELGDDHLDTASILNSIGIIHSRLNDPKMALRYFEQAMTIRQQLLGDEHVVTTGSLNNIGVMHFNMGRDNQARTYFERVLKIRERQLSPNHLLTASTLNNLGDLLNRNGEHEEARPYLERSVKIKEMQLGSEHPSTLSGMVNLGLLLSNCGEYERGQLILEQARVSAEDALGPNHQLTGRIYNTLGRLYMDMENLPEAQKNFEHALLIRRKNLGVGHADTGFTLLCLGELYLAISKFEAAHSAFQQALTCLEPSFDPSHDDMQRIRNGLAAVERHLK
ncbi:MAG: FxSxx-COOH system tetratricopeptide repeat protein [Chloroflexota bacterium]